MLVPIRLQQQLIQQEQLMQQGHLTVRAVQLTGVPTRPCLCGCLMAAHCLLP